MTDVTVTLFFHAPTFTCSYVVADPDSRRAAIIDPVLDYDMASARTGTSIADDMLAFIDRERLQVDWILETHAHADHLTAAPYLKRHHPASKVAIGRGICAVQRTFSDLYHLADFPTDGSQFDQLFDDGDRVALGGLNGQVMAAPGHTSDSVCYRFGDAVFVGDTLFAPDYGSARTDFPGGDAAMLYRTIRKLFALPDATRLYLCHDYMPGGRDLEYWHTVADQRARNIHLADGISEADFVAMRTERDAGLAVPALIIPAVQVNIRAGRLPAAESNGVHYLKVPVDVFGRTQ